MPISLISFPLHPFLPPSPPPFLFALFSPALLGVFCRLRTQSEQSRRKLSGICLAESHEDREEEEEEEVREDEGPWEERTPDLWGNNGETAREGGGRWHWWWQRLRHASIPPFLLMRTSSVSVWELYLIGYLCNTMTCVQGCSLRATLSMMQPEPRGMAPGLGAEKTSN